MSHLWRPLDLEGHSWRLSGAATGPAVQLFLGGPFSGFPGRTEYLAGHGPRSDAVVTVKKDPCLKTTLRRNRGRVGLSLSLVGIGNHWYRAVVGMIVGQAAHMVSGLAVETALGLEVAANKTLDLTAESTLGLAADKHGMIVDLADHMVSDLPAEIVLDLEVAADSILDLTADRSLSLAAGEPGMVFYLAVDAELVPIAAIASQNVD